MCSSSQLPNCLLKIGVFLSIFQEHCAKNGVWNAFGGISPQAWVYNVSSPYAATSRHAWSYWIGREGVSKRGRCGKALTKWDDPPSIGTSFGWEGVLKAQNLVVYLLSNSWRSLLEVLPVIHLKASISLCKEEKGANAHKLHVKLSGCIFQISDRQGKEY